MKEKIAVGKRYGKWTVLSLDGKRGRFRCECGTEVERFTSNIVSGKSTQCRACGFKQSALAKTNGYDDEWAKDRIFAYFRSANNNKREFTLTREECWALSQSPCYYCGEPPALSVMRSYGQINFNGIDRINSLLGYVQGNVRPACWPCNSAKKDMTDEDFMEWLTKAYHWMVTRGY